MSTGTGRVGVRVSGVSAITDVRPGDSAAAVLSRIKDILEAFDIKVQGPRKVPGTDQAIICVIEDAAGRDPRGGIIGTLDVAGLGRLSNLSQPYRADLALADDKDGAEPEKRVAFVSGDAPHLVELKLRDRVSSEVDTLALEIPPGDPGAIADALVEQVPGLVVGFDAERCSELVELDIAYEDDPYFALAGIAIEGGGDKGGPRLLATGTLSDIFAQPEPEPEQKQGKG